MNGSPQQQGFLTRTALSALWLYKRAISPVFYLLGARCRHLPTCSDYAADAFRRHGLHKGVWLTLSRLSRCHPLGSHGYDPAPEDLPDHGWRLWRYGDWSWRARGSTPVEKTRA